MKYIQPCNTKIALIVIINVFFAYSKNRGRFHSKFCLRADSYQMLSRSSDRVYQIGADLSQTLSRVRADPDQFLLQQMWIFVVVRVACGVEMFAGVEGIYKYTYIPCKNPRLLPLTPIFPII